MPDKRGMTTNNNNTNNEQNNMNTIAKHIEKALGFQVTIEGGIAWPTTNSTGAAISGQSRKDWEAQIQKLADFVGGKRIETVVLLPPHLDIEALTIKEDPKAFVVGETYSVRSIGDHNCIWKFEVIKRTAKTVTLKHQDGTVKASRIRIYDGEEVVSPFGRYSFSPTLGANDAGIKLTDWEKKAQAQEAKPQEIEKDPLSLKASVERVLEGEKAQSLEIVKEGAEALFDVVKDPTNWKNAIDKVVALNLWGIEKLQRIDVIKAFTIAIEFFTATRPTFQDLGDSSIRIQAPGYFQGPAN